MEMGYKGGDFRVAERVSKECVSLPVHPGLTEEEVQTVIDNVLSLAK
jgi:dTDP-4-amino-4,6-dideoxygalactose transaminase